MGPSAPHITWTTTVDIAFEGGVPTLLANGVGGAYAFTTFEGSSTYPFGLLCQLNGRTGAIEWSQKWGGGAIPLVIASGAIETFGLGVDGLETEGIDISTGQLNPQAPFGPLFNNFHAPVVGRDGSLYFSYLAVSKTGAMYGALARLQPAGTVVWDTGNLADGAPLPGGAGGWFALGLDDEVILSGSSGLIALDPMTGSVAWTADIGEPSPLSMAVASDGAIAALVDGQNSDTLFLLEPTGATRWMADIGSSTNGKVFVRRDGSFVVPSTIGLVQVSATGVVGSTFPLANALSTPVLTVDEAGTVYVTDGMSISAIDLATGTTRWMLMAPNSGGVEAMTLTSTGGLIVVGGGTAFGAADD